MPKEKLNKLQGWILEKCLIDLSIDFQKTMEFFGKKYTTNIKTILISELNKDKVEKIYYGNYRNEFDIKKMTDEYGHIWYVVNARKQDIITDREKKLILQNLRDLVRRGFLTRLKPSAKKEFLVSLLDQKKWGKKYGLTKKGYKKLGLTRSNKEAKKNEDTGFEEYQKKIEKMKKKKNSPYFRRVIYKVIEAIIEAIKDLTPREQKILSMRFGLENENTHTLEEVGKEFKVTGQRIRQIEVKALERIREHEKLKKLEKEIEEQVKKTVL